VEISFLIDTNVAIQLEEIDSATGKIRENFSSLHALFLELKNVSVFRHPASEEDIENDPVAARKAEMLSRLKKYPLLQNAPQGEEAELDTVFKPAVKSNDKIDRKILYAVQRNCVNFLISEDDGVHDRAKYAKINDRVFRVAEAVDYLNRKFKPTSVILPNVTEEYAYNLNVEDKIFDSLKAAYDGFVEKWWKPTVCQKRRKAWVVRVADKLAGFCIYKHDESEEHDGVGFPSMKLSTFKISDYFLGKKYGELLLKMAFNYATKNHLQSIWLTTSPQQTALIYLLKDFGFRQHANLHNGDLIFFKHMNPPKNLPTTDPFEFYRLYHPHHYDDQSIAKYVIPIKPKFHEILFPEVSQQQVFAGFGSNTTPGNTIKKVYLSRSKISELPAGSVIYFYVSSPTQQLTTKAIVESSQRISSLSDMAVAIGKRSVYTLDQVKEMLDEGPVLVIKFRLIDHSENPPPVKRLTDKKVFNKKPPQSIMQLDQKRYLQLNKIWNSKA